MRGTTSFLLFFHYFLFYFPCKVGWRGELEFDVFSLLLRCVCLPFRNGFLFEKWMFVKFWSYVVSGQFSYPHFGRAILFFLRSIIGV